MPIGKCDCLFITELNMEINEISKKYVKVCNKHAENIFKNKEDKKEFKFNKKKKLYFCKNSNSDNNLDKFGSSKSFLSLNNSNSTESTDIDDLEIIEFGRYKGMSFDEVCRKYRNYCVNIINLKSRKDINNEELDRFAYYLNNRFHKSFKKN